jgi:hypothetical protein
VVVFRDEVASGCRLYRDEEKFLVGVVSLAALRRPALTADGRHFGIFLSSLLQGFDKRLTLCFSQFE